MVNYLGKEKMLQLAEHFGFDESQISYIYYIEFNEDLHLESLIIDLLDGRRVYLSHDMYLKCFSYVITKFDDVKFDYVNSSYKFYWHDDYYEILAVLEGICTKKAAEEISVPFPEVEEPAEQPQAVPVKAHEIETTHIAVEETDAELEEVCNAAFDSSEPIDVYDMPYEEAIMALEQCKIILENSVSLSCLDFLYWTDRFKSLSLHIFLLEQEIYEVTS